MIDIRKNTFFLSFTSRCCATKQLSSSSYTEVVDQSPAAASPAHTTPTRSKSLAPLNYSQTIAKFSGAASSSSGQLLQRSLRSAACASRLGLASTIHLHHHHLHQCCSCCHHSCYLRCSRCRGSCYCGCCRHHHCSRETCHSCHRCHCCCC